MSKWVSAFFFASDGSPLLGLTPTVTIWNLANNVVMSSGVMDEVANGGYKFLFSGYDPKVDYQVVAAALGINGIISWISQTEEIQDILDYVLTAGSSGGAVSPPTSFSPVVNPVSTPSELSQGSITYTFQFVPITVAEMPVIKTVTIGTTSYEFYFLYNKRMDTVSLLIQDLNGSILYTTRLIYGFSILNAIVDGLAFSYTVVPFDTSELFSTAVLPTRAVNATTLGKTVFLYYNGVQS